MRFTKKQRDNMDLCYDGKNLKRIRHSWKKGQKIYGEVGICGVCGYDVFDDIHREVKK